MTPLCWICRANPANSREHKFKASDLRRFFGKNSWSSGSQPVHGVDGKSLRPVQGPKQPSMTFGPVICEYCNNTGTQPFDRAYDRFIGWVLGNRERVLRERSLDFSVIYGEHWEQAQLDLFRFFTKHLGCNIARSDGPPVPEDLRDVLFQAPFQTALNVTFHVHEDILLAPGADEGLFLGGLALFEPNEHGVHGFYSHIIVGWLMVCFWYYTAPTDPAATPWIADARVLKVGAHSGFTDEQREEVRRRAKGLPHRPVFDGE